MALYLCLWAVLWALTRQTACGVIPFKVLSSRVPRLSARIEKLEPCPEYQNTPTQFKDMVINQVGFNQYTVKGRIILLEPLDRSLRVEMEMYRCHSKEDPSSCEYYFTFKKNGVCDLLEKNENTWEDFTKSTDLPKLCPFPTREYIINGSKIDLQSISYLPVFKSYWKIKNRCFKNDKLMFCLNSEVSMEMGVDKPELLLSS